jgi:hypothetical protein
MCPDYGFVSISYEFYTPLSSESFYRSAAAERPAKKMKKHQQTAISASRYLANAYSATSSSNRESDDVEFT